MIDRSDEGEARRPDVLTDSILPLGRLEEMGRARAATSGAVTAEDEDVSSLSVYARAAARDTEAEVFDPTKNPPDRVREDAHRNDLRLRPDAECALARAVANYHDRERAAAGFDAGHPEPRASDTARWSAILAISFSLAPTVHDRLLTIPDQVLSWIVSLLLGAVIGALVTYMELDTIATGRRTAATYIGLVAGLLVGTGAYLMRVSGASTSFEHFLAAGLSTIEVAAVLYLYSLGARLRDDYRAWAEYVEQQSRARREVVVAEAERRDREAILGTIEGRIKEHRVYVESRQARAKGLAALEEFAVAAILRGYYDEIGRNAGYARGVPPGVAR